MVFFIFVGFSTVRYKCATNPKNQTKRKLGNPLFIEVSEFYLEVPGGFEPPWTVLQTVD